MNSEKAGDTPNDEIYALDLSDRAVFNMDIETLLSMGLCFPNVKTLDLRETDLSHDRLVPFLE